MADISDYLGLITSEHSDKPKFMAMLQAVLQPMVDSLNAAQGIPADFDLDQAIGAQLDIVGLWVGVSRNVNAPLSDVYFSFDVVGLGFDQGAWKGPFDPDSGIVSLDDDTYRILIRAKIGANRWDGTLGQSKEILDLVFSGDTHVFIEDRQDMSMVLGVSGVIPSALFLALLTGGYIPIKPEGVQTSVYVVTSVSGAPIFGFDMNNEYVAGFDVGAWGGSPDNVVYPQTLDFDFTTGTLDPLISFSRTSPATRFNSSGVLETVAANVPRFDYDPVTLQPRGVLVEGQATNLLANSENLLVLGGLNGGCLRAASTFNKGLANFVELQDPANSDDFWYTSQSVSASSVYTGSVHVKKTSGNSHKVGVYLVTLPTLDPAIAVVDTNTGAITSTFSSVPGNLLSCSVTDAGDAWRISLTRLTLADTTSLQFRLYPAFNTSGSISRNNATTGNNVFGMPQLEAGPLATSYIPTTGVQVARAADIPFVPISTWYNNLEGTLQAKFQTNNPAQTNRVASLFGSAGQMIVIDSNGQCEVDGTFVSPAASGANAAVAFRAGDSAAAVAGAITGTGAPDDLPDFPKGLYLGSLDGQSQFLNGWLQQLQYQPKRLPNADLITLTT